MGGSDGKQREEATIIGRLLSLELLLLIMGAATLIYGLLDSSVSEAAVGAGIIIAILLFMRRRNKK